MTITHNATAKRSEAGFTLVELAVVMIIIGLLIGGVLKGQELINNAQVTATVSQVKAIDAATTTFRDMYDAMPGDIANPGARLPNCLGIPVCNTGGDSNTRVDAGDGSGGLVNVGTATPSGEATSFFVHLAMADLVTGINPTLGAVWGGQYPSAEIAGGFHVGFDDAAAPGIGSNGNARMGHYLFLSTNPGGAGNGNSLTPNQAQRIDTKLDDGVPDTGSVFDDGGCLTVDAVSGANIYDEANQSVACDIWIRFQS